MNICFVYEDHVHHRDRPSDTILPGVTRDSVGVLLKDLEMRLGRAAAGHRPDHARTREAAS